MRSIFSTKSAIVLLILLLVSLQAAVTRADQTTAAETHPASAENAESDPLQKSFAQITEQRKLIRSLQRQVQAQ